MESDKKRDWKILPLRWEYISLRTWDCLNQENPSAWLCLDRKAFLLVWQKEKKQKDFVQRDGFLGEQSLHLAVIKGKLGKKPFFDFVGTAKISDLTLNQIVIIGSTIWKTGKPSVIFFTAF